MLMADRGAEGAKPRAPLTVTANADGTFEILDGNATAQVLMLAGWQSVPVSVQPAAQEQGGVFAKSSEKAQLSLFDFLPAKAAAKAYVASLPDATPAAVKRAATKDGMSAQVAGELFTWAQKNPAPVAAPVETPAPVRGKVNLKSNSPETEKAEKSRTLAAWVSDRLATGAKITSQELFDEADRAYDGTQAANIYTRLRCGGDGRERHHRHGARPIASGGRRRCAQSHCQAAQAHRSTAHANQAHGGDG
jgi:hypothetical protein